MATHWADIQQKTFTAWCNNHLKVRGMHINNMATDFRDGLILINLLEVISAKSLAPYNKHPKVVQQKYENAKICLDFLGREGIKLVNIGAEDICDGRLKLILGLIWTLILRYQVQKGSGDNSKAKNELLEWVRSKIPEYDIKNFTTNWNDGRALNALNNALQPGLCPNHRNLDPKDNINSLDQGMDTAYNTWDIPKLLDPADLANPKVDEQSVMTYISYFRDAEGRNKRTNLADKCTAYGPGLVEGIVNEPSEFTVVAPKGGRLEVKVFGPKSQATPSVTQTNNPDGTVSYKVSYTPTEPGEYKVHVTLDGNHIPGSIFTVQVLAAISLGGEGKIRVFYSTTSSSDKGRSDVVQLQRLLEAKGVHLRPDFEPWIPVDTMDKPDRDAVFKKAGTRALPIVYIDDVYTGDYDTVQRLEEEGKLNQLLNYNAGRPTATTPRSTPASTTTTASTARPAAAPASTGAAPALPSRTIATPAAAAPKAGGAAPAGAKKFCSNCGGSVVGAKFCSNCGTAV